MSEHKQILLQILLVWCSGGGTALLLLRLYVRFEHRAAIRFFDSLHGEAVDFPALLDNSSFFIGKVIELEFARRKFVHDRAYRIDTDMDTFV